MRTSASIIPGLVVLLAAASCNRQLGAATDDASAVTHDAALMLCVRGDGARCAGLVDDLCPAGDGCNWCGCGGDWSSRPLASCTLAGCVSDAGPDPATCQTSTDCRGGKRCVWDRGCQQSFGRCAAPYFRCSDHTPRASVICDCSGMTRTIQVVCDMAEERFAHPGACS
jgi:hypothetical protein